MEPSEIREQVLNLGKALIEELSINSDGDTLGRWMAHYVAEQMSLVDNTTGEEKAKAEKTCFETILRLWHHRAYYPRGQRPFDDFEHVFEVLERLDPENSASYFYSLKPDDSDEVENEIKRWLDAAIGVDEAARMLLEEIFHQAALQAANDKTLTWLENSVNLPKSKDTSVISRLLKLKNDVDTSQKAEREWLESRIKKLDAFREMSQALRDSFAERLEQLG